MLALEKTKSKELAAELKRITDELTLARGAALDYQSRELELERTAEEKLAAEREKRIEHTQHMAMMRLGKKELTLGWTTWLDGYREYQRQIRVFKAAANRLSRPRLVHCFSYWQHDWETEQAARSLAEQGRLTHEQAEEELAKVRDMLAEVREQLAQATANAANLKETMDEQLAAEREKRIEHTQQMAMLRLGKRELALGWTTWLEVYSEYQRKLRSLKAASARLSKPRLVSSFVHWQRDWEHEKALMKSMSHKEQLSHEASKRHEIQSELAAVKTELAAARKAMLDGTGREAELQRQMEEQLAAEREKRIAHAQHMAMMRLAKKELVLGWTNWLEVYQDHLHKLRALKAAANRLSRPRLVSSFMHWHREWEIDQHLKSKMTQEEKAAHEAAKHASVAAELAKVKAELKQAREAMLAGTGRETELQRQMEEQLAAEREKRIAHAQHMAMMRLTKKELVMGWTNWLEVYQDRQRNIRALQAAANRLSRPRLVASFVHWQRDWEHENASKARMTQKDLLKMEAAKREELLAQVNQLKADLAAAREAMLDGTGREAELQRQAEEQLAAEREKRIEHAQHMAMMRLSKKELVMGWTSWLEVYQNYQRNMRSLKAAANRLARPRVVQAFSHWHREWDIEEQTKAKMTQKERIAREESKYAALAAELRRVKAELAAAREAALNGTGREAELQRQMEEQLAAEREKRIAHAQHMAMMRLAKKELVLGWTNWLEVYQDHLHKLRALKAAANRLSRPRLVSSFMHWHREWEIDQHLKSKMTQKEKTAHEAAKREGLQRACQGQGRAQAST